MIKQTLRAVGALTLAGFLLSACAGATPGTTSSTGGATTGGTTAVATDTTSAGAVTSGTTSASGSETTTGTLSGSLSTTGTEALGTATVVTGSLSTGEVTGTSAVSGTAEAAITSPTNAVTGTTEAVGTSASNGVTSTTGTAEPTSAGVATAIATSGVSVTGTVAFNGTPVAMPGTIIDVINSSPDLQTLARALNASGLMNQLSQQGPYTLFVPSDQAFAKMSANDVSSLMANQQKLAAVLQYHIAQGNYMPADLTNMTSVKTLSGAALNIKVDNGVIYVNDAKVVRNPIVTSNGTIYIIDTVLTPPGQ